MAVGEQITRASAVRSWFERRSYDHAQFADIDSLARRKRELDLSLTAILPTREVATTVGPIVDRIHALNERAPLVDQLLVVDADSEDGTAAIARGRGAEVYLEDELVPEFGPAIGKGDAMWRALSVARGDLILFLDSDTSDFGDQFVYGVVGPLLRFDQVRFVKALYSRPWTDGRQLQLENGARVTELTAKPLLNYFYPQLAGFAQPLAGEVAAPRELLCSIPFLTGYAVETGMLIDVLRAVGLDSMAQVDLGRRTNRNQSLFALGRMSYAVLIAVASRLLREGRLSETVADPGAQAAGEYLHAIRSVDDLRLERGLVEVVERPPMAEFSGGGF
jgi:glucosyl-3-phosphoglycerate synthase